ncbi:MAG: hypothetical protein P8L85_10825 [Rubripirellula sp.]|nr:hypothetical protein [Rubripirellula sp.]
MRDSVTDLSDQTSGFSNRPGESEGSAKQILQTVESNALSLRELLQQVAEVRDVMAAHLHAAVPEPRSAADGNAEELQREFQHRILQLEDQVYDLEQQNSDLASQVASQTVQETVSADAGYALSWEERKQLILEQMEQDSFSADEFVSSLQEEKQQLAQRDPAGLLDELRSEMDSHVRELSRRDQEIQELRHLLDEQSHAREDGTAIGATAVAEFIDADELIIEERQRLQQMQHEWEGKFRKGEIEMSLERAQLSRERQALAKKQTDLELQLEQLRQEAKHVDSNGSQPTRKWLAKLGLSEE